HSAGFCSGTATECLEVFANCTISGNSASGGAGGPGGGGGFQGGNGGDGGNTFGGGLFDVGLPGQTLAQGLVNCAIIGNSAIGGFGGSSGNGFRPGIPGSPGFGQGGG